MRVASKISDDRLSARRDLIPASPADRRIVPYESLLGKISDSAVAALAHVSASSVLLFRKKYGYPALREGWKRGGVKGGRPRVEAGKVCEACGDFAVEKFKGMNLCGNCLRDADSAPETRARKLDNISAANNCNRWNF